jgi:hypothetical protein
MSTFRVTRKTDGEDVYRYQAGSATEWGGFEFATHTHEVVPDPEPLAEPETVYEWERLEFMRRFTAAERIAARQAEATDPIMGDFFDLLRQAATVHSNDPDVILGLGYMVQIGLLASGRPAEILGGD